MLVDESVIQSLEAFVPLAPLHQPHNLEPIRIVRRLMPGSRRSRASTLHFIKPSRRLPV